MRNAFIIDGIDNSHEGWLDHKYKPEKKWHDWLQYELQHRDILASQPQFPNRWVGGISYPEWAHIMDRAEIKPDTILIGHSAGGGFLLRYLSEHPEISAAQLALVAPWIDPDGRSGDFYKFEMDKNLASRIGQIDLFISSDDDDDILESAELIHKAYPEINMHKLDGYKHFNGPKYDEILAVIK